MKKCMVFLSVLCLIFSIDLPVFAEEPKLYAKAAVLMDADSGKILYGKSEETPMANASTTKILTCLYIVRHCNLDDWAEVSQNAQNQPKVHLGVKRGEKYKVRDLLYGLMLESFNDCAVVLAEYAKGSVASFSKELNKEAKKIGAKKTHFVSPNGLDASDEKGAHQTNAIDLAMIMRQCIKNKDFLTITRTKSYHFKDFSGNRTFTCNNHNALLSSMPGAISGKTGYTSKAGYCYVGAFQKKKLKMIAVVLASGWPPHKSYKWSDIRALAQYGEMYYDYQEIIPDITKISKIYVNGGMKETLPLKVKEKKVRLLLKKTDKVEIRCQIPDQIEAPVKKGQRIGAIRYMSNGKCIKKSAITALQSVQKKDYWWYFGKILEEFSL